MAMVNYGEDYGKICVIVDIAGPTEVLVDGPKLGVTRQLINLRKLSLTSLVIKIQKGARTGSVQDAIVKEKLIENWAKTTNAQKLKKQVIRSKLNDFERFQVMVLSRRRSFMTKKACSNKK